jgi:hypothetical protein
VRVRVEELAELARADRERLDRLERPYGARSRRARDRADLADEVARAAQREDRLLAERSWSRSSRFRRQDVDAAGIVALVEDRVARVVVAHAADPAQLARVVLAQRGEEAGRGDADGVHDAKATSRRGGGAGLPDTVSSGSRGA